MCALRQHTGSPRGGAGFPSTHTRGRSGAECIDGYPIYGDRDMSGARVLPSQLDACNGITSATPEFPLGVYHDVLLDVEGPNSSPRCFTGEVDSSVIRRGMGGAPGRRGPLG